MIALDQPLVLGVLGTIEGKGGKYLEKVAEIVQGELQESILICRHPKRDKVMYIVVFLHAIAPELRSVLSTWS